MAQLSSTVRCCASNQAHSHAAGACGHDFCQRCLRQWTRHQQHTTIPFLGSVTCPVCRKVFAAGHTAVEDLGVCIRLRDTVALLFPEHLAVRKAEVQQEEARAAAAAQPASRPPALAPAAGPPALAAAAAAGTAAPPAAALLFDDAWDDDQEEEEDEYTEVYDWVVGCPIPYGLESGEGGGPPRPPGLHRCACTHSHYPCHVRLLLDNCVRDAAVMQISAEHVLLLLTHLMPVRCPHPLCPM